MSKTDISDKQANILFKKLSDEIEPNSTPMNIFKSFAVRFWTIIFIAFVSVAIFTTYSVKSALYIDFPRFEADKIVMIEIAKYCARNNLRVEDFSKPEISSTSDFPWIYDLETSTTPKHLISVTISRMGFVETSHLYEGNR